MTDPRFPGLEIRAYRDTDEAALIDLWSACELVVPWNDPGRDIQRKLRVDPDLLLVGIEDEQVVASVMGGYDGHRGWINYLAVHPRYRRRGFGRQIMTEIEELISAKDCPKINLQIRETNQSTRDFYIALGYDIDPVISMGKRLESDRV